MGRQPNESYGAGDVVDVEFALTGDGGPLLPSYLLIQRRDGERWTTVARDSDWDVTIEWHQRVAQARWRIPADMRGEFRLAYVDTDKPTPTQSFTVG